MAVATRPPPGHVVKASTPQGGFWYAAAVRQSDLPYAARLLAFVLASVADSRTGSVRVSYRALAQWTGMGRSTVHRQLRVLADAGFLRIVPPPIWLQQRGEANRYFTMIPPGFVTRGRAGSSPAAGLGVVPLARGGSPAAGPSTTGLSPRGRSGSASAATASEDYPRDPIIRDTHIAILTCSDCSAPIRESQRDGDTHWCYSCAADPATTSFVAPSSDPMDHSHEWPDHTTGFYMDHTEVPFPPEDTPCAICGHVEDDHLDEADR